LIKYLIQKSNNMATEITMETDWGAKGAQLTGAQVQAFIKGQLTALHEKDSSLQEQINNSEPRLQAATDGCFVTYHRKSDNWPLAVPYWKWPALEQAGEKADGVLVLIDGQAPIIVSPTGTQLKWSKNAVAVNADTGSDYNKAYVDYTGKTRTAAIMAKGTELFGEDQSEWTNYAPAWCNAYDRSYDKGDDAHTMVGIGAGKWWLPSIAELIIIWKHKYAINQCLSVISGASPLVESWHWSSTEYSASYAWYLYLDDGSLYHWYAKVSGSGYVRAVAAFH
jgi:hypothetical protein